jgi:hypothetical protein
VDTLLNIFGALIPDIMRQGGGLKNAKNHHGIMGGL